MRNKGTVFAAFFAFIAGCLVGFTIANRDVIRFRPEISFGETLNAILAIVLLGVATTYLQKTFSDLRSKKDLLFRLGYGVLDNLAAVEQSIRDVDPAAALPDRSKRQIDDALTGVSNSMGTLEAALKRCSVDIEKSGFSRLNTLRTELKDLITNDPYPQRIETTISRAVQNPLREMRIGIADLLLHINDR